MKQITNWRNATVADIEADELLDKATKIHVLSYKLVGGGQGSFPDYDRIRKFFQHHIDNKIPVVMHNGKGYDVPLVEKLLGMDLSNLMLIDSLPISWYLNTERNQHGLDSFFPDYGIAKPKIDDWTNLTYDEYKHRCEMDVEINSVLWEDFKGRLDQIYSGVCTRHM
jgi:DNA polymerase III alpha subunit (gram-positive type)